MTTLLFDLDDTLVHSSLAYRRALTSIGVEPDGQPFADARATVKRRLGANPASRNRLLYFKALLEAEQRFSPRALLELMTAYERALIHELSAQWTVLGRHALLSDLAQRYELIIVTNENTRTQILKLDSFGASAELFSRILTSEEIGYEKPAVEMFRAVDRDFRTCVMIGDSAESDIAPALALGMRAIMTTEFVPGHVPPGAASVTHLAALSELLQ